MGKGTEKSFRIVKDLAMRPGIKKDSPYAPN